MTNDVRSLIDLIQSGNAWFRLRRFNPDFPSESEDLLVSSKIHFGNIRSQDDVFEGDPEFSFQKTLPSYENILELARRQSASTQLEDQEAEARQIHADLGRPEHFQLMRELITDRHRRMYHGSSILSFFRDASVQKHWDEYAGRGEGYGLVFDFNVPWVFQAADGMEEMPCVPFEVRYLAEGERPKVHLEIAPIDPKAAFRELERALLTKSGDWSHQREERLIRVGTSSGNVEFPAESLRGLIFGPRISDANRERLLEIIRRRPGGLPVVQAIFCDDGTVGLNVI